jgi:hypothetical protein
LPKGGSELRVLVERSMLLYCIIMGTGVMDASRAMAMARGNKRSDNKKGIIKFGHWGGPLLCGPVSHDVQGLA